VSPAHLQELPVVECLPYRVGKPGFALPLLAHPDHVRLRLVQEIDEYRNVVCGFQVLEDYSADDAVALTGPFSTLGGEPIHVFIAETGGLHAGRLDEISPFLNDFVNRCPHEHAVILQIRELIGTDQQKRDARLAVRRDINRAAGASAAGSFYEGDVLRTVLWQHILETAADEDAAKRILRVRPRLSALIQPGGYIELDLRALDVRDYARVDQASLREKLSAEFSQTSGDDLPAPHHDIKPSNLLQTGRVSELLNAINRTRRQEERIAILIDTFLKDRELGLSALAQYKEDRGKFATWALHELRSSLMFSRARSPSADEEAVANLIPRFFTKAFPLSRGDLLYLLAWHLAKWPKINAAIRYSLNKTRSMFVNAYRAQIEDLLNNTTRDWDRPAPPPLRR
jgi:hypothetical protein